LTDELLKNAHVPVNRGKFVDPALRPDATFLLCPEYCPVHVEMDLATESYKVIKHKIQRYLSCGEPVVWIAPTESRMDGIRSHAKAIAKNAFFKLAGSPYFYDYDGWEYRWEFLSEALVSKSKARA
jgi:hypothetical protein